MVTCRDGDGIVGLRTDELVAELKITVYLAEQTLFLQPGQCVTGSHRREADHVVQGEVGEAATEYRGEIQRGPRRCVKAPDLAVEHCPDCARHPQICNRLRVEGFEVAQQ